MSLFSFILIIVKLCETCLLCGDYSFAKVINPRRWGKKCFLLLNFSLFYFVYYLYNIEKLKNKSGYGL